VTDVRAGALATGQTFTKTLVSDLKRTQLVQYAGASGDYNPLHSDEPHAREIGGFPGVFAHGMLTMAMTGTLVSDVLGIENVTYFGGRFTAQVWPGDTLVARMEISSVEPVADGSLAVTATTSTANQDGTVVFRGRATARMPRSDA
jgi:acyl dehydratase